MLTLLTIKINNALQSNKYIMQLWKTIDIVYDFVVSVAVRTLINFHKIF